MSSNIELSKCGKAPKWVATGFTIRSVERILTFLVGYIRNYNNQTDEWCPFAEIVAWMYQAYGFNESQTQDFLVMVRCNYLDHREYHNMYKALEGTWTAPPVVAKAKAPWGGFLTLEDYNRYDYGFNP